MWRAIVAALLVMACSGSAKDSADASLADASPPDADVPDAREAPWGCGDGVWMFETEGCDDGNRIDDDGCNNDCESSGAIGCADGRREGLLDRAKYPVTAACAGAWDLPGVQDHGRNCQRHADGTTTGCTIMDVCAEDWFVCGSFEGFSDTPSLCADAVAGRADVFYTTVEVSSPIQGCNPTGPSALFGCGNLGSAPPEACAPLDRSSGSACADLSAPWACDGDRKELDTVVKPGPEHGGVLCCGILL